MKYILYIFIFTVVSLVNGQTKLDSLLQKENKQTVPYITVAELVQKQNFVLLDSRELEEYQTSHIQEAICVGYDKFKLKKIQKVLPKERDKLIIVYCSLGIRSEDIAEKLQKAGYTNVYNLYGGIFEWKNQDQIVVDAQGKETENVHTFNEDWSIWLKKGTKIFKKSTPKKE
ncbi:rhodanese-like domain-containing protein [Kordia zhangzhouensis]|uniref:rhodanese-like domain-containing protein n=1 Tax=Kordia zhangzhouensis TaxID=1620405 RepID=UPI00062985E6|nr:rhodanese-like domain-containing protein [Kordia zhangzhouensis]